MNYILQEKAFWHKSSIENNLKPTARLVYLALFHINNECGWKKIFQVTYGQVLSITGIANPKTYYSCLQELVNGGYIAWEKGPNQYQAASFELKVLYQNSEEQGKSKVKANGSASSMHLEEQGKSKVNIPKPVNNKPLNIKTKEIDKKGFIPPSLEEVRIYFHENGYLESIANKAFEMYNVNDWHDSKNNPVLNWKQKMISVWFKDENKISHERKNYGLGSTARVDPKRTDGRKSFGKL